VRELVHYAGNARRNPTANCEFPSLTSLSPRPILAMRDEAYDLGKPSPRLGLMLPVIHIRRLSELLASPSKRSSSPIRTCVQNWQIGLLGHALPGALPAAPNRRYAPNVRLLRSAGCSLSVTADVRAKDSLADVPDNRPLSDRSPMAVAHRCGELLTQHSRKRPGRSFGCRPLASTLPDLNVAGARPVSPGLPSPTALLGCHQPPGQTGIDPGGPLA